jgi:DNA-binding Xre family transcriptional regulator
MRRRKKEVTPKTKLGKILQENEMEQLDLHKLIVYKTGKTIGLDRISHIVSGKKKNYTIQTAKTICQALGITLNDLVD